MWELDHKESWVPKIWCFWTVMLKTLESRLDSKIKPANPEGHQSWIFIGRTDAEAEASILWLPDVKSRLTGEDPDAGKDWGQEKKGMTEGEMVGWHHWLDGREFEQAPGVGDGQGNLVCCRSQGHKELDTTEQLSQLNWLRNVEITGFSPLVPQLHRWSYREENCPAKKGHPSRKPTHSTITVTLPTLDAGLVLAFKRQKSSHGFYLTLSC